MIGRIGIAAVVVIVFAVTSCGTTPPPKWDGLSIPASCPTFPDAQATPVAQPFPPPAGPLLDLRKDLNGFASNTSVPVTVGTTIWLRMIVPMSPPLPQGISNPHVLALEGYRLECSEWLDLELKALRPGDCTVYYLRNVIMTYRINFVVKRRLS